MSGINLIKFIKDLENAGTICVSGHQNPDGDAVGACFALSLAIGMTGKKPLLLLEKFSERFNFLNGGEFLYSGDLNAINCDVFISLDCATKERLGTAEPVFDRAKVTYNFDHHISNTMFADNNLVDTAASSTSEIVYEIINHFGVIDADIAAALYTGIIFDTGSFRHGCTSPKTLNTAAHLMEVGIDFSEIQRRTVYEHNAAEARAFGTALSSLKLELEIKFAYVTLSEKQMIEAGATAVDLDGIVEYILNIRGIEVSALITERNENCVKVSLRSKHINVSAIASEFGGGGHVNAAGATLYGTLEQAVKEINGAVKRVAGYGR